MFVFEYCVLLVDTSVKCYVRFKTSQNSIFAIAFEKQIV